MFPRAAVKRFNEQVNDTPAPGAYDVKDLAAKGELEALCRLHKSFLWPFKPKSTTESYFSNIRLTKIPSVTDRPNGKLGENHQILN